MDASQLNPKIEPFGAVTEEEKTNAGTIAVTCGTKADRDGRQFLA
jgi:hypothetical protein